MKRVNYKDSKKQEVDDPEQNIRCP